MIIAPVANLDKIEKVASHQANRDAESSKLLKHVTQFFATTLQRAIEESIDDLVADIAAQVTGGASRGVHVAGVIDATPIQVTHNA